MSTPPASIMNISPETGVHAQVPSPGYSAQAPNPTASSSSSKNKFSANTGTSKSLNGLSTSVLSQSVGGQTITRPAEYETFVHDSAQNFSHLKPLGSFLSWNSEAEAEITLVKFRKGLEPVFERSIPETDLETWLEKDTEQQLYVVENISPNVVRLLGGYFKIDPQFFVDYLDIVLLDESKKGKAREGRVAGPRPWYRLGDIENHLPSLRSVDGTKDHVFIRFVGPREYHPKVDGAAAIELRERLDPDPKSANVERIAGGHNPIQLDDSTVWPVALARHSAAAWFSRSPQATSGDWLKGVILLDPPFESSQASLDRQRSKYRSFANLPLPGQKKTPHDFRDTYLTSLLHCFRANEALKQANPSPIAVLQDVYRIVASEWIAVNAYLERDLNAIEWKFEQKTPDLDLLEILNKLFMLRRRTRKYQALVNDQLQLRLPDHWQNNSASAQDLVRAAMKTDFEQVQDLIRANDDRITQTTNLITSVMSVLEGQKSVAQNKRLTFLTILAAIFVPFNGVAAILGMQTTFGPGGKHFWGFWAISVGIVTCSVLVYGAIHNKFRPKKILGRVARG
ncbi:uncharacterized protein BDR25DRAFT_313592 [Lindgomyces ingoldianus]|uniref:Uncharacterized protein n=1 Tax=Lindgomyces ingoldianus TaxID=673940 RepID=A0ACB6QZP0_9PLEO|nr:uncharacterized protein BDR25DRAFT_313592 [Lindgomyces ingoldianus]KAF2471666.1 hypothetical protein BDR25DRAFT_313592 [Lindgomyces ingoldianus]